MDKFLLNRKVFKRIDDLDYDLLELSWAQEFDFFLGSCPPLDVLSQRNRRRCVSLLDQDVLLPVTDDLQGANQVGAALFSQVLNLSIPLRVLLSLA